MSRRRAVPKAGAPRHEGQSRALSRARIRALAVDASEHVSGRAIRHRWNEFVRRIGITRYGQGTLVIGAVLWCMGYVVAGTAMYLFAYGVVLLLFTAYLLVPRRLKLEAQRVGLFPRTQEGDRLNVEVQLTARGRIGSLLLEDLVPERLGHAVRVPVEKLSTGSSTSYTYSLRCTTRGVYQVGPLIGIASDPLNLTQRETRIAEPFELLVHPRIEVVSDRPLTRQFEDPPIRPPFSKPWPSGLEFYGMREYALGDDLRRIVWRASARTGKLMVREAEQGITDHITVMLDTDKARHSRDGEGFSESFEAGIRAAASLGVRHLQEGYEVKVETNSGPLTRSLRGGGKQLLLLDAMARLEMSREPLEGMIRRLLALGSRDAHNILVTPHLGPHEAAQLRLLLDTGVSILVVALLWDEESDTIGRAAGLGCQVIGLHPGGDLKTALFHEMGAGAGRR